MEKTVPTVPTPRNKRPPSGTKSPPARRISVSAYPVKSKVSAPAVEVVVVTHEKPTKEPVTKALSAKATLVLAAEKMGELFSALSARGFLVVGPTVRDGAIVYERIESVSELPRGWSDEQEAAHYRLKRRNDQALFGYAVGPQSWKKFLHPAEIRLWSAERQNGDFRILNNETKPNRWAFVGVRACELAAMATQDRVLLGDQFRDPIYGQRRDGIFIVAVQCTRSAPTCFCASMGTGPDIRAGFDLCLTELLDGGHRFVVQSGSERGRQLLSELAAAPARDADLRAAEAGIEAAAEAQVRSIDTSGIKDLLYRNFNSARWEKVAARCLTCANCTMVCPTCFCTTVEDTTDVTASHAERWRKWDSCFTLNFSYIHGGSIRNSGKARYRQWMTHKLAAWIDQFGSSGCVGCGRCITWCPAGIDITEEVRALREGESRDPDRTNA
jgi:formate hydrogenlyase subunit 6/NADH:ubiquinone oxidoreductase subunit I